MVLFSSICCCCSFFLLSFFCSHFCFQGAVYCIIESKSLYRFCGTFKESPHHTSLYCSSIQQLIIGSMRLQTITDMQTNKLKKWFPFREKTTTKHTYTTEEKKKHKTNPLEHDTCRHRNQADINRPAIFKNVYSFSSSSLFRCRHRHRRRRRSYLRAFIFPQNT